MTQQLVFDIIHNRTGAGYTDVEARIDASGKQFLAVSVAPNAENTNVTQIELYMAPAGQPYPQAPDYVFTTPAGQQDKIDAVALERSGRDLIVYGATHAPGAGNRALHVVAKKLLNVFDTNPQFEAESNGRGAEVIPAGSGGGGGGEVDYAQIERIVDFVVSRIVGAQQTNSLVQQFGGNVRDGIEQKAKDALVETLIPQGNPPQDPRAVAYQDNLFPFLKNAAANPLANVLGGQDAWGKARQEELRTIIREEVEAVIGATEGDNPPA